MPARRPFRAALLTTVLAGLMALPGPASAQLSGADLSVTKADTPDPVTIGAELTYTVTVRNDGPLAAPGVIAADTILLPTLDFVSATPSQGSCEQIVSGAELIVLCDLGTIGTGGTATVTIVTKPKVEGGLVNIAVAVPTPPALDLNPLNNVAGESTTVIGGGGAPGADLAVSKGDAPDPVAPGGTLNYTITVQNQGADAAGGVFLTDVLPPIGATFLSASSSQGSCGAPMVNLVLVCDIGALAEGQSATVQVSVTPTAEVTLLNTATGMATSPDPNPTNNIAAASTTVDPNAATPGGGPGGPGGGKGAGQGGCTILGTALDDKLTGTAQDDVICGLDGNDLMLGLNGRDVLRGGKDNDRGNGGKGPDTLTGQSGKDRLRGAAKRDRLNGGGSRDRLAGGPGKDRINGGAGKDRCARGKGDKITKCP
jgi:uncharacterized repeat protein (TIGR01451 family)